MMRKHSRYDTPDRGKQNGGFGQNSISSSDQADNRTAIDNMSCIFFHKNNKPISNISLSPSTPNNVITAISLICISLFIIITIGIIQPTHQQLNTQLCPKVCICDEKNLEVSCNGPFVASGLPHTLNPSTKRITINHAQTTQFTSSDLDYFRNLEVLDLAFNKLTTIDFDHIKSNINLISLNASHNNIVELKDSAVSMVLSKLSTASSLNIPTNITESDDYKKLRRSKIHVVELNISHNQITTLRNFIFMRWHRLQRLDLSHNSIEVLENESLFGLSKLEQLILRGNRITHIPKNAMQSTARSISYISSTDQAIPALETIDLGENPLMVIEASSFASLGHVREIYLDSCLINTIDPQAFEGLSNITFLSLANNDLTEIPTDALSVLNNLKILKLDSNDVAVIRSNAFRYLYNLEELYLNNGSLLQVDSLAFHGLISLKSLHLDYNMNLSKINTGIFDDLPRLTYLTIRSGSLTGLAADKNITDHPLNVVDLRENSLTCDCDLKWLTRTLRKLNETTSALQQHKASGVNSDNLPKDLFSNSTTLDEILHIKCAGPAALQGKQIISLPDNKLECLRPSSSLNVHIGFASLFCMILVFTTVCLINFCRNEKRLMGILKQNIVQSHISMMLPYNHAPQKNNDNFTKETQLGCAEYEPIDYGQNYGPIYTLPRDQYNINLSGQQTHEL
jgi:Leucine-rich repeat (LRR) protein